MSAEEQAQLTARLIAQYKDTQTKHALLQFELQRLGGLLRSLGETLEQADPEMADTYMRGLSEKIDFTLVRRMVSEYRELAEKISTLSRQIRTVGLDLSSIQ